jgi:hypothetical protein
MTPMPLAMNAAGCTSHAPNLFLRHHQKCYMHILPLLALNYVRDIRVFVKSITDLSSFLSSLAKVSE